MPVNVTRTSSLFTDSDGDNIADPGEILLIHILIQNATAADIANLKVYDSQNGLTIDTNTIQITPIAFDDFSPAAPLTIVGNTPYIVSASALLGNDVDIDGPEALLAISGIANQNHVTVTHLGGGNYQIVPETGYQGVASFEYFITDEDGLASISSGKVNILISGQVWYVDNGYAGANGASDGSYLKPFTSLGQLNDDGTGGAGTVGPNDSVKGDDDVDGAGDTIFVYNRGTTYTGGITLEAGQKLHGDGHEMTVNGFAIGAPGQTANSTVNYSTYGVTLGTDNTLSGLNLNGTANTGVGIQDGGGSVTTAGGTLNVDTVTLSGSGQAVDIDQGGNLNVALTSLSSTGTAAGPAVQLAGTAASGTALISGTFTASGGSIAGETGHGFQIGGQGPSSGGTVAVTYSGTIGSSSTGSAVNIADRIANAGDINFTGNITQTSTSTNTAAGISLSNIADGNINFTGTKTIAVNSGSQSAIQVSSQSGDSAINFSGGAIDIDFAAGTTGHAFSIASQSGTSSINVSTAADIDMVGSASGRGINIGSSTAGSVSFTGGNLTISTRDGAALFDSNSAGSTHSLNISGSGNTLTTTNGGQLVEISNAATTGITFSTITTGASVANTAVHINNLDGGSFNTGTITVTGTSGAGSDGVRIEGGSTAVFNLGTVGVSNVSDDGVEINGAGNGAVTIDSISVQNTFGGQGVEINGATAAVTITGGAIGNTNDSAAQGVLITGGNGNVTIGASVAKTTSGNVVDVNNHTGGTVAFGGAISATASGGGITLVNNSGSTINFTNTLTLTTSTTNGIGFNATGGGTVSATGSGSTISSGSGVGINVANTNIGSGDLNFQSVNVNGAANGIVLNTTGSAGGLTITGTGTTAGSGGTIQNTTGRGVSVINGADITLKNMNFTNAGTTDSVAINTGLSLGQNTGDNAAIHLQNVTNVTLDRLAITGGAEQGINGHIVANFNLSNSTITNVGNASDEDGIHFYNMSGKSSIASTVISGSGDDNVNIQLQSGNLDLSITGNGTLAGGSASGGVLGSGYLFGFRGTSTTNLTIDNVISQNNFSGGFVIDSYDSATLNARVNDVDSTNNNDQFAMSISQAANVDGEITNSTFTSTTPNLDFVTMGILGGSFSTGTFDLRIHNNTFNVADNVTADAIVINQAGGGQMNVALTSNTINYQGTQRAVLVQAGTDGNGTLAATIQGNTIDMKEPGAIPNPAFLIQTAVTGPNNTSSIDLNMGGAGVLANTFLHSGGGTIAAGDIRVRQRNDGTINLDGYSGGGQDVAAIQNYLNGRNNEVSSSTATVDGVTPKNYTGNATSNFIVVSVSTTQVSEDGATNLVYTFTRLGNISSGLVANFAVTGTATAGTDYFVTGATTFNNANGLGTVTFAAGSATAQITVDPSSDGVSELDESVVVDSGRGSFARGLITNDDAAMMAQPMPEEQSGGPAAGGNAAADLPVDRGGETVTAPAAPEGGPAAPAGSPAAPPAGVVDDGILSQAELNLMVAAAIERWAAAGASAEQIAAMKAVKVSIADMMGLQIGGAGQGLIQIDNDAAGYGWFVDSTPGSDSEYAGSGTRLIAASGPASGRVDLLTVLVHELGHQIGLEDDYRSADGVDAMYGYMGVGERRLPAAGDAARANGKAPAHEAFILAPVADIGTLPAGKSVEVRFNATIDSYFNQIITPLSNKATVQYDINGSAESNTNVTTLDTLTLGNLVFLDVNKDGNYDAGTDTGIVGVVVDLYADTNGDNAWDGGDAFLATTTTIAGGLYSFSSLSAGNYIVVIKSTNFNSGGQLEGLLVTPGTVVDPDDGNTDNDNNGAAAAGGAVAAAPISLAYNQEPTAGTGNDTNNTVDFGFVQNEPPVANDDPGLTATEDQASQYSTQLTGNDTDADPGDTITIIAAGNATNGSVSVTAGVVAFTPTANFNGTATFEYTIDDGHGNTDVGLATVTVGAVNDPVTTTAPATASLNEDSVDFAVTGMSISDVDATLAPAGVYDVTLSATQGTLKLTTITGLTFGTGDGDGDTTMTFHGTLADINTALATAKYTPNANYYGSAQIQLQATDTFGGVVATGTGAATNDSDTIAITVNSVNDAPVGANQSSGALEGVEYVFSATDFSENFSDPVEGNGFAGIRIESLPATGTLKLNGVAVTVPADVTLAQLTAGNLTYLPAAGSANTSPTFQFRVQDNGGTANGGQDFAINDNVYTINIAPADIAPVLDLDADGAGTGFASAYTEGGAAAAISDTDVLITDADSGDQVEGATITITNAVAGDVLTVVGALPGAITVHASSTATNLVLTGTGTQAEYAAAIEQITFSSTSDNPTANGTNMSRTINVTITDGDLPSNVAVSTIAVTDVNDAPAGTSATITATEDVFRLLAEGDFGTVDVDGSFASVTISAVTGGGIYVDSDGSAGAGGFVLETLPKTYSKQDLIDGKVAFKANQDLNGSGVGTITFAVTDDDGAVDGSPKVLTVDVTAVNDSPVLTTGGPIAATEQTAVAILPAGAVADVDLDARNGGLGDYAGASFSVNRNPATNTTEDDFTLVAGPSFTIDGSNLKSGGLIFGTISVDGSAGLIVINFTSLETAATSALVDEVIQAVRYTNNSDDPPASVDLAIGFEDGSPGGGQGSGATDLDVNLVTVNIAGVNDAPVNDLGGTIGTGEDAIDAWLSGMTISDPDADPATDEMVVTFAVANGTLDIRTDVSGGITAADITGGADDSETITVTATLNQINATLAATNGLTYSPDANFNGDDTLTVTTNDQGANGSGGAKQDVDMRTISVSAAQDAPVAQPDAVSTAENVIGTGSLLANNGSGPDTDADGDAITVSHVNGNPVVDGQPIVLASGAILIVNADGTYSYNPNGKFDKLTDNTSGAVNTSAVGDTFEYTVTGGNTVTVTVTVNGVAGAGDWLMGDSGDNTITGTPQADTFVVSQGGNDSVSGLASDDIFYFGGALTADDNVTGGSGVDTIVLQGDYSGGLALDGSVTGVERISMLAGTNTAFGNPGTSLYDYVLTTHDDNFVAGLQVRINGAALLAGEDFTFDGSAETDAKFVVYGGRGKDDLTGGDGNDIFFFAEGGRFAAGDTVDGGDGYDGLFLRGNYTIDFTQAGYAGALTNLENLTVSGAGDERYARGGGTEFDYSITWDGDLLAGGATMTVNGSTLGAEESLAFNGSDESDGNFKLFGGAGNDVLTGGAGTDLIFGGLRGDTLTGGAGEDIFRYDSVAESNSTERDGIQDFNAGDLIDLSRIDANTLLAGDQAFNFVGNAAFSNTAGELRFENISLGGPVWLVQGDTDGNGVSDFEVVLVINPPDPITSSDFIL